MNKYAIVFNYKPFSNSESVTEYFLPYTQDALLKIIKNKTLRKRLEESKNTSKNLDIFVEKYKLENEPYIQNIENISFGQESSNWINDTIVVLVLFVLLIKKVDCSNFFRFQY